MKFQHYDGLYGELNAAPASDYIFSELISTRSKDFDWVIRPHIHTKLFQIFMVESGKVKFQDSFQEKDVENPCLIIIPPATLHGLRYSPDVKGQILTISVSILEKFFPFSTLLSLTSPQILETFGDDYSLEEIQNLIKNIDQELFGDFPERQLMVQTYITQLFVIIQRILQNSESNYTEKSPFLLHFKHFQKLIKTSESPKTIPEFAQELNLSAVHLNRICQNVVGKSALQVVQEYLIEESKKYLEYTSHSVSEIAYLLKFEYPNYFAKLFKKQTGISPTKFRELKRIV
jgi:AraC family transcriptional regulator, transcriptional activator of pobA